MEKEGVPIRATIAAGNSSTTTKANSLGIFPRLDIGLEETVRVSIDYPGAAEGELVVVQADDGGGVDGGGVAAQKRVDAQGQLNFAFTSTSEGGVYHVTLRKGLDEKRLEFFGSNKQQP